MSPQRLIADAQQRGGFVEDDPERLAPIAGAALRASPPFTASGCPTPARPSA
jgi:hypothetical protein